MGGYGRGGRGGRGGVGRSSRLTVEFVLQRDLDDWHEDRLDVQQDVRCTFQGENEGPDGLQNPQCRYALVIQVVAEFIILPELVVLVEQLPHYSTVCVPQLLAQR